MHSPDTSKKNKRKKKVGMNLVNASANGGADFGSPDLTRGASGTGPEILKTKMPEMPDGRHGLGHAVRWTALTLVNGKQEFTKRLSAFF